MLAGALLDAGRFDEAGGEYRKLTDAAPNDPRAWYGLGMSYQALAGARLRPTAEGRPHVAVRRRAGGRHARAAPPVSQRLLLLQRGAKQLPNLHGIHAALADVYRKTGHPDWAAEEDAKERALPPADCKAHPAECEFAGGPRRADLTPAAPRPPSPEALFWQAKAANELALQAFFRLGQLPPSVGAASASGGDRARPGPASGIGAGVARSAGTCPAIRASSGNWRCRCSWRRTIAAALAEAESLLKTDPRSRRTELHRRRQPAASRRSPRRPCRISRRRWPPIPKLLAADASLGLALSRLGKHAEAVPHLEKALELDDDGSLHYQLGRAYQAIGQAREGPRRHGKISGDPEEEPRSRRKKWRARPRSARHAKNNGRR